MELNNEFEIDDIGECKKVIGMQVDCNSESEISLTQTNFEREIIRECELQACRANEDTVRTRRAIAAMYGEDQ